MTLSFIGGAIGILVGLLSTFVIQWAGWPVSVSKITLVIATLFSIGVGVFFGFYPARKAARLNPIEALRYE